MREAHDGIVGFMGIEIVLKPAVCFDHVCWINAVPEGIVWWWKEDLDPKRRLGLVWSIDEVEVIQVRIELGTESSYQRDIS